jgi:hypothetical protein
VPVDRSGDSARLAEGHRVVTGRVATGVTLELDADAVAAGSSIGGRISGRDGPATITLLRIEESPAGVFAFNVGSCEIDVRDVAGRFELDVPGALPPQATGRRCTLHYAVRAAWRPSRWSRRQTIAAIAVRQGGRAVHESRGRLDRIIPSQPGRNFHLELVDALLEGGGQLAGRVHRDPGCEERAFLVTAVCEEVWCTNFRFRTRRSPLLWEVQQLWSTSLTVPLTAGDHWGGFRFDIPGELPQATEGRVIAWRYSVEARPAARRPFPDRAVLTPLRFEV